MKVFITIFIFLTGRMLFAQTPNVEWAKCYGGSSNDRAYSAIQTSDGGYLVCGYTDSNDGDVTLNKGNSDAWLVKVNPDGSINWQKTYGGTNADIFRSIAVSSTGYVVCGETSSNDGDVSSNHGMSDYWVVGIGITGNLIWEKTYGGSDNDYAYDIAISDSGYFVVGQTFSEDGDVSTYKANGDAWLISINAGGTLLDEKARGGTAADLYTSIIDVQAGGFLLGGTTYSNDGNVSGLNHGGSDAWLVKVSKSGNFQWTACYGDTSNDGLSTVMEYPAGTYIISGWLTTVDDQNAWTFTTDVNGTQLSGFDLGGTGTESGGTLFINPINRYVITPTTSSAVSGDLNCHIGEEDIWMIETGTDGSIKWQLCLGGTQDDHSTSSLLTAEEDYLVSGFTSSNNEYVSGNHGSFDWWLVKLQPVCATNAAFSYVADSNIISFNNNSENSTSWYWSFGDGDTSIQKHPIHEYDAIGTYEVCLISKAVDCLPDTFCAVIQICGGPAAASYTYSADGGTVTFTNASSNASDWAWSFGDGETSTLENPLHTYLNNGKYEVCLTAIEAGCSESIYCDSITVCAFETWSQFEFSVSGGAVNFFSTAPSATSWFWTFGDGSTSVEEDPEHFYDESGTYEACLVVTDVCGSDTSCQTLEICVLPDAGFSYFNTSDFTFNFIDESLYTTEWLWLFGDGNSSTESNPVYTFDEGGTFEVCLVAQNECGNDTSCTVIVIECPPFETGFGFTQSNDTAFFSDQSSATANNWLWYFDDGSFSIQQNPVHVFEEDGTYNVCLISSDDCSKDTVCHKITVVGVAVSNQEQETAWSVFPNPVEDHAEIEFFLSTTSWVTLDLKSVTGSTIHIINNHLYAQGRHTVPFERHAIPSGIYLLQIRTVDGTMTRKLILN